MVMRAIGRSPVVISRSLGVIISCKLTFPRFPTESKVLWILIVIASVSSTLDVSGMLGFLWMKIEAMT